MRILVFSDTHGNINNCINLISNMPKVDMIIHAGDCTRDAEDLMSVYPNIPIHYVAGNNDFFTKAPDDLIVNVLGKRIFITHGHGYRVKSDMEYDTLLRKSQNENIDLTIFGHTHESYTGYFGDTTLLNPGSTRYCGTYGVVEIEEGNLKTAICKL